MCLKLDKLEESLSTGSLVDLYTNPNDLNSSMSGVIVALSETDYIARILDSNGRFDGFHYRRIGHLLRVASGGPEREILERVSKDLPPPACPITGELSRAKVLKYLKESRNATWAIDYMRIKMRGFVVNFDEIYVEMSLYNGVLGYLYDEVMRLHDVSAFCFGGPSQLLLDGLKLPKQAF